MNTAKNVYPITGAIMTDNQLSIAGIEQLPEPLTPADCDLTTFPYFPFEVVKFRGSEFATTVDPAAGFYAITLWAASWHQVPAASLPDNDVALANLAGFGRYVSEWLKIKDQALYGFVKCSDGRLYHKHLATHANEAWELSIKRKQAINKRWEKERAAKACASKEEHENNTSDTSVLQVNNTSNTTKQNRTEQKEDKTPFNTPHDESEERQQEPTPKATGKQSPKKDVTKLTQAWIDENTDAMKSVYFAAMRESELKATEQRWSYIRSDFIEHWINSASNADKFKKKDWLGTWKNQVEKQINYNKLKWKAEESSRNHSAKNGGNSKLGSLDDDYLKDADWERIFKGEG